MDQTTRVIISMAILYGALAAGYVARRQRPGLTAVTPKILRFALLFLDTPLMALIFWLMKREQWTGAWKLPLIGFTLSTALLLIGIAVARMMRLKRAEEGAFACGASISNIGFSFGGLLCLMILGVNGATLSQVYTLYLNPFAFMILFQVAAWYSGQVRPSGLVLGFFKDPVRSAPVAGMAAGVLMNLYGPPPPACLEAIVTVWVLVATAAYSFGIGGSVFVRKMREQVRPCLALGALKFIVTPLLAMALASLFELTPLQRQVVFIVSMMPMAIFAVVIAGLTNLARDLANSCWLFTTLATLPLVIPIYLVVTRFIH